MKATELLNVVLWVVLTALQAVFVIAVFATVGSGFPIPREFFILMWGILVVNSIGATAFTLNIICVAFEDKVRKFSMSRFGSMLFRER